MKQTGLFYNIVLSEPALKTNGTMLLHILFSLFATGFSFYTKNMNALCVLQQY